MQWPNQRSENFLTLSSGIPEMKAFWPWKPAQKYLGSIAYSSSDLRTENFLKKIHNIVWAGLGLVQAQLQMKIPAR